MDSGALLPIAGLNIQAKPVAPQIRKNGVMRSGFLCIRNRSRTLYPRPGCVAHDFPMGQDLYKSRCVLAAKSPRGNWNDDIGVERSGVSLDGALTESHR